MNIMIKKSIKYRKNAILPNAPGYKYVDVERVGMYSSCVLNEGVSFACSSLVLRREIAVEANGAILVSRKTVNSATKNVCYLA